MSGRRDLDDVRRWGGAFFGAGYEDSNQSGEISEGYPDNDYENWRPQQEGDQSPFNLSVDYKCEDPSNALGEIVLLSQSHHSTDAVYEYGSHM